MKSFVVALLLVTSLPALAWNPFKSAATKTDEAFRENLNRNSQSYLSRQHATATIESLQVEALVYLDASRSRVVPANEAAFAVVRYLLRWHGIVQRGGLRDVVALFDLQRGGAMVEDYLLSTNGVTNSDVVNLAATGLQTYLEWSAISSSGGN